MKHRHHFQNQQSANARPQLTTTNSNHTQNNNGESATAKPQASIEKSIQTSIAVRPLRDQVALRAYQIYLQEGRPQGRDLQHWLGAEAQLAAVPPVTIKTEMTVKNEVGATAKTDKPVTRLTV